MLTQSRMRSFRDGSLKLHCDTPFLSCSKSGLNHIAWEKRDAKKTQQSFPLLLSMFEVLVPPDAICIGAQLASSSLNRKKPSQLKHGKHGCRMNLVFCDDCMWPSQSFPENMFLSPERPPCDLSRLTCAHATSSKGLRQDTTWQIAKSEGLPKMIFIH